MTNNGDPRYDQELFDNDMEMSYDPNGNNLFEFDLEADCPNLSLLKHPSEYFETHGITLQANYRKQEFFRCTYFMSHMYPDDPNKKDEIIQEKLRRKFAQKTPTILNKEICWDSDPVVQILKDEKNETELKNMKSENANLFNSLGNPFSNTGGMSLFDQNTQQEAYNQLDNACYKNYFVADDSTAGSLNNERRNGQQNMFNGGGMFNNNNNGS